MKIVNCNDILLICMFFSILFIVIVGIIIRNHYKEKYERELKLQISLYEEDNKAKMEDFKFQITRLYVLDDGLKIFDSIYNKDNK